MHASKLALAMAVLIVVLAVQSQVTAQLIRSSQEDHASSGLNDRTFWATGDTLSRFDLVTLRGDFTNLTKVMSEKTHLIIFFEPGCPVCHESAPLWNHLDEASKKSAIGVIGVALWQRDSDFIEVRRFTQTYRTNFPLYLVPRSELSAQFKNLVSIPQVLLCGSNRVVTACWHGAITTKSAIEIESALNNH
jgi:thiol-disulfide isomerase/thioredoxin